MTQEQEKTLRNALESWFEVYSDSRDADSLYRMLELAKRTKNGCYSEMEWLLGPNTRLGGQVDTNEVLLIMKEVGSKACKRLERLIGSYSY